MENKLVLNKGTVAEERSPHTLDEGRTNRRSGCRTDGGAPTPPTPSMRVCGGLISPHQIIYLSAILWYYGVTRSIDS